ncbi:MAG: haloacid dehalogenase [Chloroflexi bacterium]|nr:haloacid dehalogenase [Chloroflexota bacterium]
MAEICEDAVQHLGLRNQAREQALPASREVIRFSANAIRAVHRGEFEEARQLLDRAAQRLKDTEAIREENPEIYFAGFMIDARKEYTEAHVTLAVLSGQKLPKPQDLGVEPSAFLNGMAEVIGEVRRYILDSLRRDSFDGCQEFMDVMDEIYSILVTVDFPEAVTGGLRHSTDQMRGVLERTRGDLTMALRQHKLEAQLAQWERRQSGSSG